MILWKNNEQGCGKIEMVISYIFAGITLLSIPAILIGMIKPAWVTWWEKKEKANRKKVLLVYIIIFAVSIIITNLAEPEDFRKKVNSDLSKVSMYQEIQQDNSIQLYM